MRKTNCFPALAMGLFFAFLALIASSDNNGNGIQGAPLDLQQRTMPAPPDVATPPAGVRTAKSGVAMKVIKPGRGAEHPRENDCVKMHFTVWQRDGTMLLSSRLRDTPEVQCIRTAFPGVAEALKSMVVGEERRIWVPGRLTFSSGDEDEVPSKVDVTIDLELLTLIKAPPTPPDLKVPPKTAMKTASGLAFRTLEKGTGTRHPSSNSQVTLHLSGWTVDGALFESTERGGKPATYIVTHLIPGLHEGVLKMVVGEKRRFWIPAALAYGETRGRRGVPVGNLVYDVKLLTIE